MERKGQKREVIYMPWFIVLAQNVKKKELADFHFVNLHSSMGPSPNLKRNRVECGIQRWESWKQWAK